MTETELRERSRSIPPPDAVAREETRRRLDGKTKPRGSLGRIETLAAELAAMQGTPEITTRPRAVVVCAADHGVAGRRVSAYPREVTGQMLRNFAGGGAAVNVLARETGTRAVIVDLGVDTAGPAPEGVVGRKVRRGTWNFCNRPAMTVEEALATIGAGEDIVRDLATGGIRLVATGEMGIGNTTAAAALVSVLTSRDPADVTGRGTGIDDEGLRQKIDVIRRALRKHRPCRDRALETLAALGGFEIAGLVGVILAAATRRIPVVLDGFITGAAALVATSLAPAARDFLVASHRSAEPGHGIVLETLGLEPLLDFGLRLGEGTGALLALPLLDAAARITREMASFESAGVSEETKRED